MDKNGNGSHDGRGRGDGDGDVQQMYEPYIDESRRLHIFCLCDGTYIFLLRLVNVLVKMGCRDICTNGDTVTEGIPEDRPWCNYLFEASGILPEEALKDGKGV